MQKLDCQLHIEPGTNPLYFIYSLTGRGGLACAMLSSGANSIFSNKMQASEFDSHAVLRLNMVLLRVCMFEHTHTHTHTHGHTRTHACTHTSCIETNTRTHTTYANVHSPTHAHH